MTQTKEVKQAKSNKDFARSASKLIYTLLSNIFSVMNLNTCWCLI